MNVVLVIDEAVNVDFILREFFEEVEDLGDYLGMRAYLATSRGKKIKVYFYNSLKDSLALRTEDLFLFEDIEVIVNVGYCFCSPEQNKIGDSEMVVVASSKCDHEYRGAFKLHEELANKRIVELDKRLEKRVLDSAEKLGMSIKPVSCCSVTSFQDLDVLKDAKLSCGCFDQKALALYEIARTHNRNAVCLYRTRSHNLIDLQHYLLEKSKDSLNDLVQIALEFEFRCRIK